MTFMERNLEIQDSVFHQSEDTNNSISNINTNNLMN